MKTMFTAFILTYACISHGFSHAGLFEEKSFKIIKGEESCLNRPEGIAFAPDGKYIAIANSTGNNILFYEVDGSNKPVFILQGPQTFIDYPHDVSFSPDGNYLAVASRDGNLAAIYKKRDDNFFHPEPICTIRDSSFREIGSVAYSPNENILAIGDTYGNRVLIYSFQNESSYVLKYIIQTPQLSIVDGLCFSSDGKILAVTSHGNHKVLFFQKTKDLQTLSFQLTHKIENANSLLTYPHSIAYHPIQDCIVVSSAGGDIDVSFYKKKDPHSQYLCYPIQIYQLLNQENRHSIAIDFPEECGAKGVAFSPDGKILGICLPNMIGEDEVHFFREKE